MNAREQATAVDGRGRAIIENVQPSVDAGRFAIKRCVGDVVTVEADAFIDGHDAVRCVLMHRRRGERTWRESEMAPLGNDRWRGAFGVTDIGAYEYAVSAWADEFATWSKDIGRWTQAPDVAVSLATGATIVARAARRAAAASRVDDARLLKAWAEDLAADAEPAKRREIALDPKLGETAGRHPDRSLATTSDPLPLTVDPQLARFSAWYELFPRSAGAGPHGTFADCERLLPEIAAMGFNILYFPPIHPIGTTRRKGRNNSTSAAQGEPGSPWAIGARDGGHTAIHRELGTAADFRRLVHAARTTGIEIALDIAFQASPDHPWVRAHPEWFRHRPDGTVQFAENPPKKYEDIYPFNFESDAWRALWEELRDVFLHWIAEGVRVFRVDNPHTKPFPMWEWLIGEIKAVHPSVIFLSEAFTRPRIMHRLAKLGFSQSYTYFTWRNTKTELTEYFTELAHSPSREYFRPNVWPNTPDILHEYLQRGGRPAFAVRLLLASTLAASYGIYGPAFELSENRPREAGSEEYLNSEKYEIKRWDTARADSLRPLATRLNLIRRENPALQQDWTLRFVPVDNDRLIAYVKTDAALANVILCVVNLNPFATESGWVDLPLPDLGLAGDRPFEAHDLLADSRFRWHGARNYVELRPGEAPGHVFHLKGAP
jgi:starch synthase (maltosyl-transferring)